MGTGKGHKWQSSQDVQLANISVDSPLTLFFRATIQQSSSPSQLSGSQPFHWPKFILKVRKMTDLTVQCFPLKSFPLWLVHYSEISSPTNCNINERQSFALINPCGLGFCFSHFWFQANNEMSSSSNSNKHLLLRSTLHARLHNGTGRDRIGSTCVWELYLRR